MSWYGPCERAVYYSQRNNPNNPAGQCLPTALVTALVASGQKLPDTHGEQPEAHLAHFAETDDRVLAYMQEHQAWAVRLGWPPYTEHNTLAFASCLWIGFTGVPAPTVTFSTKMPLEAIVADLACGRCSVLTGRFTPNGHGVAIVGVSTDQWLAGQPEARDVSLSAVKQFMVHDPWGDYHQGYKNYDGSRCLFTPGELMQLVLTEGVNAKWAHRINTGGKA